MEVGTSQPASLLEGVARRLDQADIPWAVFAGAAASTYGATRPITDVDILVPAAMGGRLLALFPEGQFLSYEPGVQVLELPGIEILAGLSLMDLDAHMAVRLTRHKVAGISVPVIPPEDNVLLKAMWGRGQEEGKHDWEDVEAMLANLPELDWEYLRWRADACLPPERKPELLGRLEDLWHRLHRLR